MLEERRLSASTNSHRCLAIARSHTLLGNFKNTLALLSRALALSANITSAKLTSEPTKSPPNLIITKSEADSLTQLLHSIAAQYRALVTLQNLATTEKVQTNRSIPMIERLDEYPPNGADLTNLVIYPPRVRPLPVKPIFLDVAWNYIDYPGRVPKSAPTATVEENVTATGGRAEGKKGWFGFGR
jgi:signal recognition particle subunit SRP68